MCFEENEEMLNSEMKGGGVGANYPSVVFSNYLSVTDIGESELQKY